MLYFMLIPQWFCISVAQAERAGVAQSVKWPGHSLGEVGFESRRDKWFFVSPEHPDLLRCPLTNLLIWCRGWSDRNLKLTAHFLLMPMLRMSVRMLLHLYVFIMWTGTSFMVDVLTCRHVTTGHRLRSNVRPCEISDVQSSWASGLSPKTSVLYCSEGTWSSPENCPFLSFFNPYPTAFPYGNGMVLHFYQQQESSMTKTVHRVINKGLKTYV